MCRIIIASIPFPTDLPVLGECFLDQRPRHLANRLSLLDRINLRMNSLDQTWRLMNLGTHLHRARHPDPLQRGPPRNRRLSPDTRQLLVLLPTRRHNITIHMPATTLSRISTPTCRHVTQVHRLLRRDSNSRMQGRIRAPDPPAPRTTSALKTRRMLGPRLVRAPRPLHPRRPYRRRHSISCWR